MKRFVTFIILLLGLIGFLYYENNYDTQNICENSHKDNVKNSIEKNPQKALEYTKKWKNACNVELLKNKQSKTDEDFNKTCRMIDKAAMSTLTYVSIVKRHSSDKALAPTALQETINNMQPYSNCVEYNLYSGMLNQSLEKIK